jgi:urea transporter/murein DD-endopeptidase MepM/ murein hydrolase activator NlpD
MKAPDWFWKGLLNSYTQIFFSENMMFAAILIPVSFIDVYAGLFGLISLLITNSVAYVFGLDPQKIQKGYYGFNSLLVGLGLGIQFEPALILLFIVLLASVLTLFISVTLEGVIGKYYLPHLSLPFVFALWMLMLSTREFDALNLNERWIYTLNDLYIIGGPPLVSVYEWWNQLAFPSPVKSYFLSLGAILFQYSVFSGVLLAIGLVIYSRIAFTLSLIGFFAAWAFYGLIGAEISEVGYSYVGFNFILTAIAVGGFFIIPNIYSYIWAIFLVPLVAIIAISVSTVLSVFQLPVYALPFNIIVLVFLYVLKFRTGEQFGLYTWFVQRNSPEKNLYSFLNYRDRFYSYSRGSIKLPFFGEWKVTQGHNGNYTHKGDWSHAWDFEIEDEYGKTYQRSGDYPEDYYCYNKSIVAPADGTVEEVIDGVEDNVIGQKNLAENWGNTVVIKHSEFFYSKLSHLKEGSLKVKRGDRVHTGDILGVCGNSGNSPYPHLHFQIQETPYIGSKTLNHPLTNYYEGPSSSEKRLIDSGIPEEGQFVSNIQVHSSLKKAFDLVPGRIFEFKMENDDADPVIWEVKIDSGLNRYVECRETGSKAYFKNEPAMLHFLYFEGDRSSLLYKFYLSAYKVSFGFENGLVLQDSYPLHLIFNPNRTFLQDFIAPFYRYLDGVFTLSYPDRNSDLQSSELELHGTAQKRRFGKNIGEMSFSFRVDGDGLREFQFTDHQEKLVATCVK